MDFINVVKNRKSIRKYGPGDISLEKIKEIIEISSKAPSGGNCQNWFCVIIKNQKMLLEMKNQVELVYRKLIGKDVPSYYTFFKNAPVVLGIVEKPYHGSIDTILEKSDKDRDFARKYLVNPGLQNVSSFITYILLAAENEGLGACWMTGPLIAKEELEGILDIKKPDNLVALIPIGEKTERQSGTSRKDINEIISVFE